MAVDAFKRFMYLKHSIAKSFSYFRLLPEFIVAADKAKEFSL